MIWLGSLVLMVCILSFSGKNTVESTDCAVLEPNEEENELFWESLSRQFSGSVSAY
jgi:hypothetical protein